eukprot:scaffold8985_cov161-Skeletonema_marinoi.AAC.1
MPVSKSAPSSSRSLLAKIMIMTSARAINFNEPRPYSRAMSRACGAVPCQCFKEDDEMVIVITTSSRHGISSVHHSSGSISMSNDRYTDCSCVRSFVDDMCGNHDADMQDTNTSNWSIAHSASKP